MQPEIRVVEDADSVPEDALAVRQTVFVDEQGVPAEIEVDEHESVATHFIAYDGNKEPVGTARLRTVENQTGKVERLAVLDEYRGQGLGTAIMQCLEDVAREWELDSMKLHSQTRAAPFYEELGYERYGEEFEEAGIPHVAMRKQLSPGE